MRLSRAARIAVPQVLSLLVPGVALAQPPGSLEVGGYGQITVVDPQQARFETRTPLSLGLRGRVNLHRGVGVELEASTGLVDGADLARRRYNQLVARGTYTIPVSDYLGVLIGAGLARSDYEVTYNFGPSLLLGMRSVIRGRYALRSDVIFNKLPTSGATEFALRTGLQVTAGPFDGPTTADRRRGTRVMAEPGSIEGGLFGQQWRLHPRWNLQSGRAIGARVGTFITSRSAVEVEATYGRQPVARASQPGSTGFPLAGGSTYRLTTFAFRYLHNLPLGTRYALLGGIGPARSSYEYVDHWGASALGGARIALTRDLHLRADLVAHYLASPRVVDVGARLGVSTVVRLGH